MYSSCVVRWRFHLALDGALKRIEDLTRQQTLKNGKLKSIPGQKLQMPHIARQGPNAKLLTDSAEYVLGFLEPWQHPEKSQLYRQLLQQCIVAVDEPALGAIAAFIDRATVAPIAAKLSELDKPLSAIDRCDVICFGIEGIDPTALECVQQFWATYTAPEDCIQAQCAITGQNPIRIASKLSHKIKGVPKTQASGASLVSAFRDSFTSFGLKQARYSPISLEAAEAFSQALAHLINDPACHLRTKSGIAVYWATTAGAAKVDLLDLATPDKVAALLQAANSGDERALGANAGDFHLLSLSGGGGRVIVRDWLQTPIADLNRYLARWFSAMQIGCAGGKASRPFSRYQLAAAMFRDPAKELEKQPRIMDELLGVALAGHIPSLDLLHRVLTRVRIGAIGGQINIAAISLIRLILTYRGIPMTSKLDEPMEGLSERQKTAYCYGRLMALCESLQTAAAGNQRPNANITDKTYTTFSTTPAKIFGRIQASQSHNLGTLHKRSPRLASWFEKQLAQIYDRIPANVPSTFGLEEQGTFGIGYWHEKFQAQPTGKHNQTTANEGAAKDTGKTTDAGATKNAGATNHE